MPSSATAAGHAIPSTANARTLVFDLDGTLSNPAVGIGRSINYALEATGYAPIAEASVAQFIGPPLDASFRALTGEHASAVIDPLIAKYRERYGRVDFAEQVLAHFGLRSRFRFVAAARSASTRRLSCGTCELAVGSMQVRP